MSSFVLDKISMVENPIAETSHIAEQLEKNGKHVLRFSIGDPAAYFKTPEYILSAYKLALENHKTAYSDWKGNETLRKAIASRYKDLYNVDYNPENIQITQGVSEALQFINMSLIEKNTKAIIIAPFFTQYLPYILMEGGEPILSFHDFSNNWNIDTESIKEKIKNAGKNKPKYILVTNPNNPTGTAPSEKSLKEVVEIAKDNDIFLISDEIYDEILYNNTKFISVSSLAKGVPHMILNGASKNLIATGFRIGFCITPEDDKKSVSLRNSISILSNSRLSANTPAQYAVAEGISNKVEHKKAVTDFIRQVEKRSALSYKLSQESAFLKVIKPNSAFYIFPQIGLNILKINTDKEFVELLLKEEHLQVIRGSGFGMPGFIRMVTLPSEDKITEAFSRIEKFCIRHKK
ncbi:MAG: pyridoxal phosphate-dependent aminotransferase [Candidatus Micrarchaeia archaeon]